MLTRFIHGLLTGLRGTRCKASPHDLAAAHKALQSGSLEEAEHTCIALMGRSDIDADVRYVRGLIAEKRGDARAAETFFELAIEAKETEPTFPLGLAGLLDRSRRFADAASRYRQALALMSRSDPRYEDTGLKLAVALRSAGDHDGAEACLRKTFGDAPVDATALELLASLLYEQSRPIEARAALAACIRITPKTGFKIRKGLLSLPAICESVDTIHEARARFDHDLDELLEEPLEPVLNPQIEVGVTPFYLAYYGENERAAMTKLCSVYRKTYSTPTDCRRRPYETRAKLRIGLVSTFFHMHSIGRTTMGYVPGLPRDKFEVCVFAIAPEKDAVADAIHHAADVYHVLPKNLEEARSRLFAAELDVLLFADIGMHPLTYMLALTRFAPIQLAAMGHPMTTGIDTIDYFISGEAVEEPDADEHFSEALLRLTGFFQAAFERPQLNGPRKPREALGLPPSGRLYMCLQTAFKMHPEFDEPLRLILENDPDGRVILMEPRVRQWREQLARRLARSFGPTVSRVHYLPSAPHAEYLHLIANADVVLDPFHFGGNISTFEAFSFGVPVVTLPARYTRGRLTQAQYREMGIDECIARSSAHYADIAVQLGREADFRRLVSGRILAACPVLFNRPDAARELGRRLVEMAEKARSL